jgi:ornithine cyclodeaminase/alanine dehydrogenase-like protein (mu-crystallin family)
MEDCVAEFVTFVLPVTESSGLLGGAMPIYLKEEDAVGLADMRTVVAVLRTTLAAQASGGAVNVPRRRLDFGKGRLNVMAGGSAASSRHVVKCYGSSAHHMLLYSAQGGLLAVMEAGGLGAIRTGAASAVATEVMARSDARRIGLIGAGRQARTQLLALRAIGIGTEVAVFARDGQKRQVFCKQLQTELGLPVWEAGSAQDAVRGADIVITATTSDTPVLMNAWLAPGAHVNAMGANSANRRELDPEIVLRASLIVTDDVAQAKLEAAELIDLAQSGRLDWEKVVPLHRLAGLPGTSRDPNAITLFKSLGIGLEDLAIASVVYDRAMASGRFKPL